MKQTVVVANPRAQNGAIEKRFPEIRRTLDRVLGGVDVLMTKGPGDATTLCREALRAGAGCVAALGGDGTIHEVANGFFENGKSIAPEAALGVLPFGTGGDFRKTTLIPLSLEEAAAVLGRGNTRTIDVGLLEYRAGGRGGDKASRVFINIASFGIGGLVDRIVNSSSKALGGKATFFLATARAAMKYKNQPVRLVFDGKQDDALELTINNVAVANGRYFGGGMHIAPKAELDDGVFDVVAVGDMTLFDFLTSGRRVYKGTHLDLPKVTSRRAAKLEASPVNPDAEILLDVDGEAPGALPATFTILPRALRLVVPQA